MKSGPIVKIDEQIVDALVSGRRKGQDLMVGQYGQEVFGMVVRLVGDVMDAEELTQDTFLRAFRSIGSYDPRLSRSMNRTERSYSVTKAALYNIIRCEKTQSGELHGFPLC